MSATTSPTRLAVMLGDFDRHPAYRGLAEALVLLIGDGRIGRGAKLPSERELAQALDVSRTTATRAYAALCDRGYARAVHGSGTYAHLPARRGAIQDRILMPRIDQPDLIDLGSAAASAPPGVAAALAAAVDDVAPYLGGHGYFPGGVPELQHAIAAHYAGRGLPTEPDQILVTSGALSAAAVVVQAFTKPGDRVLVEDPAYPNIPRALRSHGARLVPNPVDPDGWDLDAVAATVRGSRASIAYLVPDFQNPTGNLMTTAQRERYARLLGDAEIVPVVDEAAQQLLLDDDTAMPLPFASFAPSTITLGSASKIFWGGLRLGWIRAPRAAVPDLVRARVALDLGTPVLDQLALARLLADPEPVVRAQRDRVREQRDALLSALAERLPEWRVRRAPGGLSAWCRLPVPVASALTAEAERRGVAIASGSQFAVGGRLESFVRVPWIRPSDELRTAVDRLAEAWHATAVAPSAPDSRRVTVA